MITGNAAWTTALNLDAKQALYVFNIPGKSISLCSFFPLNQAVNAGSCLPILVIPKGSSSTVDELQGQSSNPGFTINANDPSGALKTLASASNIVGQFCQLLMGFPGGDITDPTQFVPVETGRIGRGILRSAEGWMTIPVQGVLLDTGNQIFLNGGPATWTQFTAAAKVSLTSSAAGDTRNVVITGWNSAGTALLTETVALTGTSEVLSVNTYSSIISIVAAVASLLWTVTVKQGAGGTTRGTIPTGSVYIGGPVMPPSKPTAVLDNGIPISDTNPRYLSGNPIDLILAAMQNELGLGQSAPPVLVVSTGGGSGTGQAGFGINPTWTFYDGSTGLITYPTTPVDTTALLNLRSTEFASDLMEFSLTASEAGKAWVDAQLMKLCGLYWIPRANGQLSPKSMKASTTVPTVTINDRQIDGIPATDRWPIINIIQCTVLAADGQTQIPITFANQPSLDLYKSPFVHTIDSSGLRFGHGAFARLFLLANRIFNRHAFATPEYTFTAFLKDFVLEQGDEFYLTHSLLLDLVSGTAGVTNVRCEVTERQPDYAGGRVTLKVIDTRFIARANGAFEIAAVGDAIPVYGSASSGQRAQYMFVSKNDGTYSTGATGNKIQ